MVNTQLSLVNPLRLSGICAILNAKMDNFANASARFGMTSVNFYRNNALFLPEKWRILARELLSYWRFRQL
jgi:hypothetical protein